MGQNYAIILAGGRGIRLNAAAPKQFLPLGGRPVILWSLETFNAIKEIDHILVVVPADCMSLTEQLLASRSIDKILKIIPGGITRQESSYRALESCDFDEDDILLIHDAARPFISAETIRKCLAETARTGATGVYIPSRDTVALIENGAIGTIPAREKTYCAQTPQGFRYSVIRKAHDLALRGDRPATDDIGMAINAGIRVTFVEGEDANFKITTDLDYTLACHLADDKKQGPLTRRNTQ